MGAAVAGTAFWMGRTPVQAYGQAPLLDALRRSNADRILVLVQLSGGNDGLNTVIPYEDDRYYQLRPSLAIAKGDALPLTDTLGLHPALDPLMPLYGDGHLALVQGVGYPNADLSHFRSSDIWLTASDADEVKTTGWAGRYFDTVYPGFQDDPPETPLAVQIGSASPLLLRGANAQMGMSIASLELFERIAAAGVLFDTENLPDTSYGAEMAFVRSVANDAYTYAGQVQDAASVGSNLATYANTQLAERLAVVAQLIRGNLGAQLYHVSISGFDTHANQPNMHTALLSELAEAVGTFYTDLATDGRDAEVLVMTFSEFGRRVQQNGSNGTDHGTAAPLFLFGSGVAGGVYGDHPSLTDLDGGGNLRHHTDFRAVYATVLQHWFGVEAAVVAELLGTAFDPLPFIANPTAAEPPPEVPQGLTLHQNYPNPFNPRTTISYTLAQPQAVRLRVYDTLGRAVQTLVDGPQAAGTYAFPFDAGHLPSGTYYYRLEAPAGTLTRSMVLLR